MDDSFLAEPPLGKVNCFCQSEFKNLHIQILLGFKLLNITNTALLALFR